VSEYTDKVDILSWRNKHGRMHAQIKDICAILSGLLVAADYRKGQALVAGRDFSDNAPFFQEVRRRCRRRRGRRASWAAARGREGGGAGDLQGGGWGVQGLQGCRSVQLGCTVPKQGGGGRLGWAGDVGAGGLAVRSGARRVATATWLTLGAPRPTTTTAGV
jgi:hypothetical protein